MKKPNKLILTVAPSAALLAGSVAATAPAQAAGPIYYVGEPSAFLDTCLIQQQQIAAIRNYSFDKGCHYTSGSGD